VKARVFVDPAATHHVSTSMLARLHPQGCRSVQPLVTEVQEQLSGEISPASISGTPGDCRSQSAASDLW
jgi:hypothetical protein